jgi:membrane protease YdiL (CAAX protease family)
MPIQPAKEEISWKASQGWLWIVAQLIWVFASTKGLLFVCRIVPGLAKLLIAHFVFYNAAVTVVTDFWLVWAAYLFSKSKSISDFVYGLDLNKRPVWKDSFYILSAVCLGLVSVIGAMGGLTGGNWLSALYARQGGWIRLFDAIYVCSITPFAEEVAERGFLYRAFRGSYGMVLSIFLIVCWNIFVHWQIALHSFFSLGCYSLFAVLVCIVREKTGSIWNCIFFHAIYNAATSRQWTICIIVFLIFLIFTFTNRIKQPIAEAKN